MIILKIVVSNTKKRVLFIWLYMIQERNEVKNKKCKGFDDVKISKQYQSKVN